MKLDDNDLIDGQGAARLLHASIYTVRDYIRDLGLQRSRVRMGIRIFTARETLCGVVQYFDLEIGREVKAVVFACGKQTRENTEVVADIAVPCQHRQDIYDKEAFTQLFEQFLNEMRLVLGGGGAR